MEESIKLIRLPLIITGFDAFNKCDPIWQIITRYFFYFVMGTDVFSFCYALAVFKDTEFSDKVFLVISLNAFNVIIAQAINFWNKREAIVSIFEAINELHADREEKWIKTHSKPLFQKCSLFLYKFCK